MSTFLDSTFLIDIVEDPAATRKAAQDLEDRDEGVVTGALNLFEVFRGVHSLRDPTRRRKLQQQYEAVIQSTMVMDLSREDALRAAGWSGALRREGKSIGVDALTAALAYRAGCTIILTRNLRDFEPLARQGAPSPKGY